MDGPYLENHEMEQLDELLRHSADDTIDFWIRTRIKGISASMALDGNVSLVLVKELDAKILPIIKPQTNENT